VTHGGAIFLDEFESALELSIFEFSGWFCDFFSQLFCCLYETTTGSVREEDRSWTKIMKLRSWLPLKQCF